MVLVQIHTTFHIVKDKYIFSQLIVLQKLISAISPGDIHASMLEKSYVEIF